MNATLKFPSLDMAQRFTKAWSRHTLTGHSRSPAGEDGAVTVEIYKITDDKKRWIEEWIKTEGSRHQPTT
jgi:hypothetical protein